MKKKNRGGVWKRLLNCWADGSGNIRRSHTSGELSFPVRRITWGFSSFFFFPFLSISPVASSTFPAATSSSQAGIFYVESEPSSAPPPRLTTDLTVNGQLGGSWTWGCQFFLKNVQKFNIQILDRARLRVLAFPVIPERPGTSRSLCNPPQPPTLG